MSSEDAWKAASHLHEGAEVARRAADSLSESTHRLTHMFEPGYGGVACRLVELLENQEQLENVIHQRDALLRVCRLINNTTATLHMDSDLEDVLDNVVKLCDGVK